MSQVYKEVVAPASYAATPDVAATFEPDYWLLQPVTGGDAFISFDGVNDDWRLTAANKVPVLLRHKVKNLWVKQAGGAATVGVAAYTDV
jgi:hypothetical protein